jgi:hypothetical protein
VKGRGEGFVGSGEVEWEGFCGEGWREVGGGACGGEGEVKWSGWEGFEGG